MRSAAADTAPAERHCRPASPCAIIEAHGRCAAHHIGTLTARIQEAFARGAPAVVVLCAAGEPIVRAREQLRWLDQALTATAADLGARVSRSATEGLAAWAASTAGPIGVDVQSHPVDDAPLDAALLDAALHPGERRWLARQAHAEAAFAQLWAGKEAVLKAFGVGLAWSPRDVAVLPVAQAWHALRVPSLGHAWLSHLRAPGAPRVALAVALNAGQAAPG